jgi:hypothetical protein
LAGFKKSKTNFRHMQWRFALFNNILIYFMFENILIFVFIVLSFLSHIDDLVIVD